MYLFIPLAYLWRFDTEVLNNRESRRGKVFSKCSRREHTFPTAKSTNLSMMFMLEPFPHSDRKFSVGIC